MPAIQYHAETLSLAGWKALSPAAVDRRVSAIESAIGHQLPASLRELMATECWPGFLEQFSNCDRPIAVEDLLRSRWPSYDAIGNRVLPFMIENQGVCTWAVALDTGDDPEVLVEVDSGNPPTWRHAAETFSLWLRTQVLDHQLLERALFAAQAEPLSAAALAGLEAAFDQGPRTFGWPGETVYRFHSSLGFLLLWAGIDQCDWWIAPTTVDTATALLDALPLASGVGGRLYELKPVAKALLHEWRRLAEL